MSGPHPDPLDIGQNLEPQVQGVMEGGVITYLSIVEAAQVSAAISLKRIADALNGEDTWALNALMENAGQAFALGMRGR